MLQILVLILSANLIFIHCKISNSSPDEFLSLDYVQSCCSLVNNSIELLKCTNKSSYSQLNNTLNKIHARKQPNLGIYLVTYATEDIWDYTAYSFAVNEAYVENNGYSMKLLDPSTSNYEKKDARWNKVKILEEALDPLSGWARDFDYIMWIDADLIFLDINLRLESIISKYPDANFIISAEHAGSTTLINSGSILAKNCEWSRQFLKDWWNYADRKLHSDQEQFDLLYYKQKETHQLDKYIVILAPDALNSDPPAMTKQKPHNQVYV